MVEEISVAGDDKFVVYHIRSLFKNKKNIYYIDIEVNGRSITILHNNLPKLFKEKNDAKLWINQNIYEISKKISILEMTPQMY